MKEIIRWGLDGNHRISGRMSKTSRLTKRDGKSNVSDAVNRRFCNCELHPFRRTKCLKDSNENSHFALARLRHTVGDVRKRPCPGRTAQKGTIYDAAEIYQRRAASASARATRATTLPRMDGAPDDPAWLHAATIDGLSLSLGPPREGLKAPQTQVKLLWSAQRLFVRFIACDDEIYAPFGAERDALHFKGDVCELFLDVVGDGQQWFEIQVSPDNGVFDKLFLVTAPNTQTNADGTYAATASRNVWEFDSWQMNDLQTATARFERNGVRGWIVDMALPAAVTLKRLGRTQFAPMMLRANLLRYDWPLDEDGTRALNSTNWAPIVWGKPHRSPAAMGFLELVETPTANR